MASEKRFKDCILHIGTEKTGTKAIQNHLRNNRKQLHRHGVLYPVAANSGNASQWEFVAAVHEEPWKQDIGRNLGINDAAEQAEFAARLRQSLTTEFGRFPSATTLLISSEHFQSRLVRPTLIQALYDWLAPWVERFKIVVYFRRQDQLSLSLLSTRLKSSVRFNPVNLQKVMQNPAHYFDYFQLYQNWAGVFGPAAMAPRIYDPTHWKDGNLIADFNATCGLPDLTSPPLAPNRSLNRQGFHFLHALNHQFPAIPGDRNDLARAALVKRVSELCPGKFYPISRSEAKAFVQNYTQSNEKLRCLAFPNLQGPMFSTDFADYPEVAESMEPDYAEAVDLVMKLWQDLDHPTPPSDSLLRRWLKWLRDTVS